MLRGRKQLLTFVLPLGNRVPGIRVPVSVRKHVSPLREAFGIVFYDAWFIVV